MPKMKRSQKLTLKLLPWIFCGVVVLFFSVESIHAEGQGWFDTSLNLTVDQSFYLLIKSQIRCHDISYQDPFVHFLEGGIGRKMPKNFYLAVIYRRQSSETKTLQIYENRYNVEAGWAKRLPKDFSFDCRFRTEIRTFEQDLDTDHFRFRLRLRLRTSVEIGRLTLKPFVTEEVFWDTKVDDFSQNRFYLGTAIPLSDKVEFIISCLRQDLKNKEPNHILFSGFSLRF